VAFALISGFPVSDPDGDIAAADSTGADLFVAYFQGPFTTNPAGNASMADSKGNTWNKVEPNGNDDFGCFFWSKPTSVGTGHTFTVTAPSHGNGLVVYAFSGSAASPLDAAEGFNDVFLSSIQSGAITPAVADSVFVAGCSLSQARTPSIDGSFTGLVTGTGAADAGTFAAAYKIGSGTTAENPTWSWAGGNGGICNAFLICFSPDGGAPPAGGRVRPFRLAVMGVQ
jgi:hypothetical protein